MYRGRCQAYFVPLSSSIQSGNLNFSKLDASERDRSGSQLPFLLFSTTLPFLTLLHDKGLLIVLQTYQLHHHIGPLICCSQCLQHSSSRQPHSSASSQMSSQLALSERLSSSKFFCWAVALNFLWVTDSFETLMKAKKSQKNVWLHTKFCISFWGLYWPPRAWPYFLESVDPRLKP